MSRRQDYIARIRYQNELPPPPCAPKLLNIAIDSKKLAAASTLSSVMRKFPINVEVNRELGMPLDLTAIPGIFERGDESGVYPYPGTVTLDPKDRALLREPMGSSTSSKSQHGVAFLRRTEYISSEALKQTQATTKADILKQKTREQKENLPEERLKNIEAAFDAASSDLKSLKHPKKKGVTAVESIPLLPDFKMLDLQYISVKMVGSASFKNSKRKFTDDELQTALFAHNTVGNDEWMSFYAAADEETATKVKAREDLPTDTLAPGMDEEDVFTFSRVQDNDLDFHLLDAQYEEVAISISDDRTKAVYVPIAGRANLKRRRVAKEKQEMIDEMTVDEIKLSYREITADESIARDNERSVFDPVDYQYSEIPEKS